jgi:hypothetical protein
MGQPSATRHFLERISPIGKYLLQHFNLNSYSRMPIPSLSRGCEIAQFFVRHIDHHLAIATCTSFYHKGDVD